MSSLKTVLLLWIVSLACAGYAEEMQEGRLMRFPDIYRDKIVFMYGGDLWLASSAGGDAHRITSDQGRELFPKFSPDGKWIAFTGQYDGNFNVYVMPAQGGQPRQLTFFQGAAAPLSDRMGIHDEVVTWTPDSKRVVFLSRRDAWNGWMKRPFSVVLTEVCPSRCQSIRAASRLFRPTVRKSPTTRSSETSAPGSATPADWPNPSRSMT